MLYDDVSLEYGNIVSIQFHKDEVDEEDKHDIATTTTSTSTTTNRRRRAVVDLVTTNRIRFIDIDTLEPFILKVRDNGVIDNPLVASITIVGRSTKKRGYALLHGYLPGKSVVLHAVYHASTAPAAAAAAAATDTTTANSPATPDTTTAAEMHSLHGKIESLENDRITIEVVDRSGRTSIVAINFAYRGLPSNIKRIVLMDKTTTTTTTTPTNDNNNNNNLPPSTVEQDHDTKEDDNNPFIEGVVGPPATTTPGKNGLVALSSLDRDSGFCFDTFFRQMWTQTTSTNRTAIFRFAKLRRIFTAIQTWKFMLSQHHHPSSSSQEHYNNHPYHHMSFPVYLNIKNINDDDDDDDDDDQEDIIVATPIRTSTTHQGGNQHHHHRDDDDNFTPFTDRDEAFLSEYCIYTKIRRSTSSTGDADYLLRMPSFTELYVRTRRNIHKCVLDKVFTPIPIYEFLLNCPRIRDHAGGASSSSSAVAVKPTTTKKADNHHHDHNHQRAVLKSEDKVVVVNVEAAAAENLVVYLASMPPALATCYSMHDLILRLQPYRVSLDDHPMLQSLVLKNIALWYSSHFSTLRDVLGVTKEITTAIADIAKKQHRPQQQSKGTPPHINDIINDSFQKYRKLTSSSSSTSTAVTTATTATATTATTATATTPPPPPTNETTTDTDPDPDKPSTSPEDEEEEEEEEYKNMNDVAKFASMVHTDFGNLMYANIRLLQSKRLLRADSPGLPKNIANGGIDESSSSTYNNNLNVVKRYNCIEDLLKDNGNDKVVYDKLYDHTPYDIVRKHRKQLDDLRLPQEKRSFLRHALVHLHDYPADAATWALVDILLEGKKYVASGDHCVLEFVRDDHVKITKFYKRHFRKWVEDTSVHPRETYVPPILVPNDDGGEGGNENLTLQQQQQQQQPEVDIGTYRQILEIDLKHHEKRLEAISRLHRKNSHNKKNLIASSLLQTKNSLDDIHSSTSTITSSSSPFQTYLDHVLRIIPNTTTNEHYVELCRFVETCCCCAVEKMTTTTTTTTTTANAYFFRCKATWLPFPELPLARYLVAKAHVQADPRNPTNLLAALDSIFRRHGRLSLATEEEEEVVVDKLSGLVLDRNFTNIRYIRHNISTRMTTTKASSKYDFVATKILYDVCAWLHLDYLRFKHLLAFATEIYSVEHLRFQKMFPTATATTATTSSFVQPIWSKVIKMHEIVLGLLLLKLQTSVPIIYISCPLDFIFRHDNSAATYGPKIQSAKESKLFTLSAWLPVLRHDDDNDGDAEAAAAAADSSADTTETINRSEFEFGTELMTRILQLSLSEPFFFGLVVEDMMQQQQQQQQQQRYATGLATTAAAAATTAATQQKRDNVAELLRRKVQEMTILPMLRHLFNDQLVVRKQYQIVRNYYLNRCAAAAFMAAPPSPSSSSSPHKLGILGSQFVLPPLTMSMPQTANPDVATTLAADLATSTDPARMYAHVKNLLQVRLVRYSLHLLNHLHAWARQKHVSQLRCSPTPSSSTSTSTIMRSIMQQDHDHHHHQDERTRIYINLLRTLQEKQDLYFPAHASTVAYPSTTPTTNTTTTALLMSNRFFSFRATDNVGVEWTQRHPFFLMLLGKKNVLYQAFINDCRLDDPRCVQEDLVRARRRERRIAEQALDRESVAAAGGVLKPDLDVAGGDDDDNDDNNNNNRIPSAFRIFLSRRPNDYASSLPQNAKIDLLRRHGVDEETLLGFLLVRSMNLVVSDNSSTWSSSSLTSTSEDPITVLPLHDEATWLQQDFTATLDVMLDLKSRILDARALQFDKTTTTTGFESVDSIVAIMNFLRRLILAARMQADHTENDDNDEPGAGAIVADIHQRFPLRICFQQIMEYTSSSSFHHEQQQQRRRKAFVYLLNIMVDAFIYKNSNNIDYLINPSLEEGRELERLNSVHFSMMLKTMFPLLDEFHRIKRQLKNISPPLPAARNSSPFINVIEDPDHKKLQKKLSRIFSGGRAVIRKQKTKISYWKKNDLI